MRVDRDAERKEIAAEKKKAYSEKKRVERDRRAREKAIKQAALKKEREKACLEKARVRAEKGDKRKKVVAAVAKKLKNKKGGFDYSNRGLLPRTELSVRGDVDGILARFCVAGISLSEITRKGNEVRFTVRKKDLDKAVAILHDMCYNYRVVKQYGFTEALRFALCRAGLVAGAACAAALTYISYSFVWRVEVSGCENISVSAVQSALSGEGFSAGCKKRTLDTSAVIAAVSAVDGVADASCEIVGTTLKVYILESEENVVRADAVSLTSAFDARVTRVIMRSGSSEVKRGDVVKAGDTLANGNVYSTQGELLYSGACDGEVYGEVSISFTSSLGETELRTERTGREAKRTGLRLFGWDIFKPRSPYKSYESSSVTTNYDLILPLYVTHCVFYETETAEHERDMETAAKEFALERIDELGFSGDFEWSYSVKQSVSGLYTVSVFVNGEALISRAVR